MSQNITLCGASYSGVPAVDLPKTGGGTARFVDPSPTTAVAADVTAGKYFLDALGNLTAGTNSGGGGGSGLTLLASLHLGTISTTSTNASSTGKTLSVTGYDPYDALVVIASVATVVNNRHAATLCFIWLNGSSNNATKNGVALATSKRNVRYTSSGVPTSNASTTGYGVYVNSASLNTNTHTISLPMYQRYSSTNTNTINGDYTVRAYGLKLQDLIGG